METQATTSNNLEDDNSEKIHLGVFYKNYKNKALQMIRSLNDFGVENSLVS